MRSLGLQLALLLLILVLCAVSFILPAVNMDAIRPGYIAFLMSVSVLTSIEPNAWITHLYLGSFWIANLFMLASPFGLWRSRLGKGGVFIGLFAFWDALTISYWLYHRVTGHFAALLVGWYLWEISLLAMTLLFVFIRRAAR